MAPSSRPSAASTPRKSHASHTPREHQNCCSHGVRATCDSQAAVAAHRRFDRIISHGCRSRAQ
eukprot:10003748-Lingulodinium_polyedra.AAC.1